MNMIYKENLFKSQGSIKDNFDQYSLKFQRGSDHKTGLNFFENYKDVKINKTIFE